MNLDETKAAAAATADPPAIPMETESREEEGFDPARHHDEIARVAHALWEQRGCAHGADDEDWLRAEAEVRRRYRAATS